MIRQLIFAATMFSATSAFAQNGYTPFSNYQNWQTSRPFYYSSPSYYQRIYSPPVVRFPYNAYRPGYYDDGSVETTRRSRSAVQQQTTRHLQNIDRSLQILSLSQRAAQPEVRRPPLKTPNAPR